MSPHGCCSLSLIIDHGAALEYAATPQAALLNAAALAIVTDWDLYRAIAPADLRAALAHPAVFDSRHLFDAEEMRQAGIDYRVLGCNHRRTASPLYRAEIPLGAGAPAAIAAATV